MSTGTLHGVKLSHVLARFGDMLRGRIHTRSMESKRAAFHCSEPVEELDVFLSHSWGSHGLSKYIAVLLDNAMTTAFIATIAACLLVAIFQKFFYEMPGPWMTEGLYKLSWQVSYYEWVIGMLVAWGTLFVVAPATAKSIVFLDMACICQDDAHQKQQGIAKIPAFIASSKCLLIAWDKDYFRRAWCSYELALFMSLKSKSNIRLLPIDTYCSLLLCNVMCSLGTGSFLLLWPWMGDGANYTSLVVLFAGAPCFCILSAAGDVLCSDLKDFEAKISVFSIKSAKASEPSDHDMICDSINTLMQGGCKEFDDMVRTEIKQLVLDQLTAQRAILPYRLVLLAASGAVPQLVATASCSRNSAWLFQFGSWYAGVVCLFLVYPCVLAACLKMGASGGCNHAASRLDEKLSHGTKRSWKHYLWHFLVGVITSLLMTFAILSIYQVPLAVMSGGIVLGDLPKWCGLVLQAVVSMCWFCLTVFLYRRQMSYKEA